MKSTMILIAALALAAGTGPAFAQQPSPEQAIAFLDKDTDGKCSLNEYLTFQVSRIAQFDANADGALQYGEFKDSLQGKAKVNAQRSFDAFNSEENRSALIQREFLGYHAYVFKTFVDTDKDGFMSTEEWSKIMSAAG
jgi:Ca2+-binding EF-hand superfamily protein